MDEQIESAIGTLINYKAAGEKASVGRKEVNAHALLSGVQQKYPQRGGELLIRLLAVTEKIRLDEPSKWIAQKELEIEKLTKAFG